MKTLILTFLSLFLVACGEIPKEGEINPPISSGDFSGEVSSNPDFMDKINAIALENSCFHGNGFEVTQLDFPATHNIAPGEVFIGITEFGDISALYRNGDHETMNLYICNDSLSGMPIRYGNDVIIQDSSNCPTGFISDFTMDFRDNYSRRFEAYHNPNRGFLSALCQ